MIKKLTLFLLPLLMLGACSNNNNSEPSIEETIHIEVEEANSFTTENKTILRDDNKKIKGELYIPDNDKELYPLLIMSHGFNQNMSNLRDNAHTFAKKGYITFVYDFIGGGQSISSDGKLTEMSVLTEAKDLNTVIEYLKEDERISNDHIFLAGQSQGGFVSTYVAGTREDIKGLIDFYPAFCIKDDALEQYPEGSNVPDPYYMTKMGMNLGKKFYTDAVSFDIYEVMQDITCDVLLMHGTADNIVPISYSQRASETIPNCRYIEFQGAGHGFSGSTNSSAVNLCLELMSNNL